MKTTVNRPSSGPFRSLMKGEQRREFSRVTSDGKRTVQCVVITGGRWGEVWSRHTTSTPRGWSLWMGGKHASAEVVAKRWEAMT